MTDKLNPVARLGELALDEFRHDENYLCDEVRIAGLIGLSKLGATYVELPPGKSACPFHVHHVEEEMFVILEGEGTYRFGEEKHAVKAGDVLGAPCGRADFAHKLTNTGSAVLKYLAISTMSDFEVCEYPDSGKFMVSSPRRATGAGKLRFIGREAAGSLDYWDGEDSAD